VQWVRLDVVLWCNVRLQRLVHYDVRARFGLPAQHTIRDIAHTADDTACSGGLMHARRDYYGRVRRSMQQKAVNGTRSTRRRCRALQRRLSR